MARERSKISESESEVQEKWQIDAVIFFEQARIREVFER
jgi:hypothetical protein